MTEVFSVILGRDRDENDETGGSDNSEERRVWVCVRGSLKDCLGCHCEAQRRTVRSVLLGKFGKFITMFLSSVKVGLRKYFLYIYVYMK